MLNSISGMNPYATYSLYGASHASRAAQTQAPDRVQSLQRAGLVTAAQKVHQPETPVQPVTPVRSVSSQEDPAQSGLLRFGSDPAEMAVRMRIQYPGDSAQQAQAGPGSAQIPGGNAQAAAADKAQIPGLNNGNPQAAAADKAKMPDLPGAKDKTAQDANPAAGESQSAQEVMKEAECQTCKERKYQDGSDDPGVSFKNPTNIAPELAASAVRGHENEHVVREQAKAQREDRKVVSQSVTYHTSICPECGKVYVSGGTTRTVTKADNSQQADQQSQNGQDSRTPSSSVA